MSSILKKLINKSHRDNRGLTLVEVICAVAILALVTGVIGSVIVISTRTYKKGISDTNIQQEAQLAANNIGNIIKDACGVIYGASGAQYIENGDTPMSNDDSSPKMQADGYTELSIITNDKVQYTMTYDSNNKTLLYQEFSTETKTPITDAEVMAQNIVDFEADTSDFRDSRTIKLMMTVEDSSTNKRIPMEYTMTSRNGSGDGGEYVTATDSVVIIFLEGDVVMVPGETYQIPVSVSGKLAQGLEWDTVTGLTAGELTLNHAEVTVPVDTTATTATLSIRTKDKDEDGNPKAAASCTVYIRKVESVSVSHSIDKTHSEGNMVETVGAVYTFSAAVSGNKLEKQVAYAYDSNYKTAQSVVWSWTLVADGVTSTREWTCTQNAETGKYEFAFTDTNRDKFDEYISVTTNKEDALLPQLVLKVEKNMPADFELTVRATSKHALGVNKADSKYYTCDRSENLADAMKGIYWNEDLAKPRETIVKSYKYVLLEPNEETTIDFNVLGAGRSDTVIIDYDHEYTTQDGTKYTADSRSDTTGTRAEYDSSTKKVTIKAGNDEHGHKIYKADIDGGSEVWDYNVYVNLTTGGGVKYTIVVNISRIDVISLEVENPVSVAEDSENDSNRGYRFNVRFNTDTEHKYESLMRYLVPDEETAIRNLSTKFTITYTNTATGEVLANNVVTIDGDGSIKSGSYDKTGPSGDYSIVVASSIGTNPAKKNDTNNPDSGYQYISIASTPYVYVHLLKGDTLPANRRLTIRAEVMHPTGGSWNKTGSGYTTVEAVEKYIEGYQSMEVPADIVVVEPGQGSNDRAGSDKEMVIPISVSNGSTYKIVASISGNSDSGTKLAAYSDKDAFGNISNPYTTTVYKSGTAWTWYLGLWIGSDETGKDNTGLIDVNLKAYDDKNNQLAETDFQLAVRRVNEVDLQVAGNSDINNVNTANSKITLEAYPKGYGKDKVEYFAKQTIAGAACRWETAGHGEYKSPYPMKWTMSYNGVEKELKEWTDYFSGISTSTDPDKHKATVTFTLKKALPSGAKLRAYSLHALGKVSSTEYNKSGSEYDEVYGELAIDGLITVSGGWKRGGTLDIAYNIPEENIYTDENGNRFLIKDGEILWNNSAIATQISFMSKYKSTAQWTDVIMDEFFTHNAYDNGKGIGGERGGALFEGKSLTEYTATIYAWGEDNLAKTSYSAPYTDGNGTYIDTNRIRLKVNVGTSDVNATDTIAVDEQIYDIPDVVFQYRNSLPETSKLSGDSDGAWTKKGSSNVLKVYVTPDDTISSYKSYYKLSEGWEETYEKYTLLPSRYVGVINDDKEDDSLDERLFDFTVTNTTGEGNEEGRSYVSFTFTKNVRTQYQGKVVKMIYEYNPYLCNTDSSNAAPYSWAYGNYNKAELDEMDGCEGILEFHFVNANIASSVTGPQVRYCPTYEENGGEYYYISKNARFKLSSDGTTAYYQTATCTDSTSSLTSSSWKTVCTMTYSNGTWK